MPIKIRIRSVLTRICTDLSLIAGVQTWRNDLNWTNTVLEQFAHGCVHDNVTGCRLAHEQSKDNQIAIGTMQLEIVVRESLALFSRIVVEISRTDVFRASHGMAVSAHEIV